MYIRWRLTGSWAVWFWLARIIRGRSQQVRTKRGVDRGSVAIYGLRQDQPVSERFFSQVRLASAITRLCRSAVGHNHLAETSQVVGTSMRVGIRIFSIVEGLGFGGDRCRGFERWLLVGRALHLLRRLKMMREHKVRVEERRGI